MDDLLPPGEGEQSISARIVGIGGAFFDCIFPSSHLQRDRRYGARPAGERENGATLARPPSHSGGGD